LKKLNIGIIAHVDAGKTTLTENILVLAGVIAQAGRVDKGDTRTDSMAVERRRGISVRAAATSFCRGGIKFNLIDTPGHVDFVAEVERSLTILDGVVLVISAKEGLQAQTRILMDTIMARQIPTVIFVNKIDRVGADIAQVVEDTNDYMGGRLVATQQVAEDGAVLDLTERELAEVAADTLYSHDDELMARFVDNEDIPPADFCESFARNAMCGCLYPVFFGSALYGVGVESLLDSLPKYLPTIGGDGDLAISTGGSDTVYADNDVGSNLRTNGNSNLPLSAIVFKVDNSAKERLAYVRLFEGSMRIREIVCYQGKSEKITRLAGLRDGKLTAESIIESGDIAVLYLKDLMVGDILRDTARDTLDDMPGDMIRDGISDMHDGKMSSMPHKSTSMARKVSLGQPTLNVEVLPTNPAERRELYEALVLLADEDPLLGLSSDNSLTVRLFGEIQMEILREILAERYGIAAEFSAARTIYMETPTQAAQARIPINKTFFRAGVGFSITPLPRGSGLQYVRAVSYGELEKSFQVAVEEAVFAACQYGLYGWEVTDMRVEFDYSDYDSVTGTPSAFRDLVPLVLMEALKDAKMALLEPILDFELRVLDTSISKAMYDLQMMRAYSYNTTALADGTLAITGQIPADTSRGYGTKVGSYTEGRGMFMTRFYGYNETDFAEEKVNHGKINPAANAGLYVMQKLGAR